MCNFMGYAAAEAKVDPWFMEEPEVINLFKKFIKDTTGEDLDSQTK